MHVVHRAAVIPVRILARGNDLIPHVQPLVVGRDEAAAAQVAATPRGFTGRM
jgi:hypothetical protein